MEILFGKGSSAIIYPVKCVYMKAITDLPFQAQVMFVAPKRSFKKAPDRNLLKRRMREAYRLNKAAFYESLSAGEQKMILAFIYTGKKEEPYPVIEKAILGLQKTLAGKGKG